VSQLPPAAAAAPGPSTALEQLDGREHASGGAVVEVGGERVAAAGNLLQEQGTAVSPAMLELRTEHARYLSRF
jgi:hypothetical protein